MAAQICESCAKQKDRCFCPPNSTCEHYTAIPRLELVWKVYHYNINHRQIEEFNIFDHWKFNEDVSKDLHRCRSREDFAKLLQSNLRYYFWSKCEYEVLVSSWTSDDKKETIKVDIYDQVMLNWESFLDYVWTH